MTKAGTLEKAPEVRGWRRSVDLASTGLLLAVLAYVALTTFLMIRQHVVRVPFWDQWQEMLPEDYLSRLFSQHNEHRIALGRLFFALDQMWFHGEQHFSLAVVYLSLFLSAFCVARTAAPLTDVRKFLSVFALCATLAFAASAWENLLCGFQVSFVPLYPLALAAFVAATRSPERFPWLLAAALSAVCAAFTMANGLLVAPLLVVLSLLIGRPRWHVAVLVLLSAALIRLYLLRYQTPAPDVSPASALRDPGAMLRYVALYLGGPLASSFTTNRVAAASTVGAAGLFAWAVLFVIALRRRREVEPAFWILPLTMTFIVGTALLTALGRARLPADQAFSSRYATPALLFWGALVAHLMRNAVRWSTTAGASILASLLALSVAHDQLLHRAVAARVLDPKRSAETALLAGVLDVAAIDGVSPAPQLVIDAVPVLRERRWSVFADPWLDWIGRPLSELVRVREDAACVGALERGNVVRSYGEPGARLEGWAYSSREGALVERVVLADEQGVVRGFALTGQARPEIPPPVPAASARGPGFTGHIALGPGERVELRAFAVLEGDRSACALERSVVVAN